MVAVQECVLVFNKYTTQKYLGTLIYSQTVQEKKCMRETKCVW